MPEDIPDGRDRKLTNDENAAVACEWSDYRRDYLGGERYGNELRGKHLAFEAGWAARHRHGYTPQSEGDRAGAAMGRAIAEAEERREAAARTRAAEGKGFECDEDSESEVLTASEAFHAEIRRIEDEGEEATRAEEPVEDRLRRAYLNGYGDGLQRGSWGRFDHS